MGKPRNSPPPRQDQDSDLEELCQTPKIGRLDTSNFSKPSRKDPPAVEDTKTAKKLKLDPIPEEDGFDAYFWDRVDQVKNTHLIPASDIEDSLEILEDSPGVSPEPSTPKNAQADRLLTASPSGDTHVVTPCASAANKGEIEENTVPHFGTLSQEPEELSSDANELDSDGTSEDHTVDAGEEDSLTSVYSDEPLDLYHANLMCKQEQAGPGSPNIGNISNIADDSKVIASIPEETSSPSKVLTQSESTSNKP